jgi:hypothetical protein
MAIDQTDHPSASGAFLVDDEAGGQTGDRSRSIALGLAVASMRITVLVALASLAILFVLPAALAAQAAVGI